MSPGGGGVRESVGGLDTTQEYIEMSDDEELSLDEVDCLEDFEGYEETDQIRQEMEEDDSSFSSSSDEDSGAEHAGVRRRGRTSFLGRRSRQRRRAARRARQPSRVVVRRVGAGVTSQSRGRRRSAARRSRSTSVSRSRSPLAEREEGDAGGEGLDADDFDVAADYEREVVGDE